MKHDSAEKKVMIIITVICTLAAFILGFLLFPADWSIIRKFFGGLFSGLGISLLIIATRLVKTVGNDTYDQEK